MVLISVFQALSTQNCKALVYALIVATISLVGLILTLAVIFVRMWLDMQRWFKYVTHRCPVGSEKMAMMPTRKIVSKNGTVRYKVTKAKFDSHRDLTKNCKRCKYKAEVKLRPSSHD